MKFFKKSDIIIIFCILTVSLAVWFTFHYSFAGQSVKAEIYYEEKLIKTIDLNTGKEEIFSILQNESVVFHLYRDGKICFEASDCPDKVCIHAGKLDTAGQFAACLPNKIVMKIVPSGERNGDDVDLVTGK